MFGSILQKIHQFLDIIEFLPLGRRQKLRNINIPSKAQQHEQHVINQQIQYNRQQDLLKLQNSLSASIKKCITIPFHLEAFILLYFSFGIFAIVKTILIIPFDFIKGIIDSLLNMIKDSKLEHTCIFSCVIVINYYIFCSDYDFFDVSVVYHSFRGQSTLKMYGVSFALEVIEKIFTIAGCHLYTNLQKIMMNPLANPLRIIPILLACIFLTLLHSYTIYLDFILYVIVLNSSMGIFTIFVFVVYLTKMKSTPFKKFDQKAYKMQLCADAKDRMQKMIFLGIFFVSQRGRPVADWKIKILCLLFIGAIIEYIKHATILVLGGKHEQIINITNQLKIEVYHNLKSKSAKKFFNWDFTVLPFCLFILKMLNVVIKAEFEKQNYNKAHYLAYLMFLGLTVLSYEFIKNFIPKIMSKLVGNTH